MRYKHFHRKMWYVDSNPFHQDKGRVDTHHCLLQLIYRVISHVCAVDF